MDELYAHHLAPRFVQQTRVQIGRGKARCSLHHQLTPWHTLKCSLMMDGHQTKVEHHARDHAKHVQAKQLRLDRHSGTGHPVKEGPKKGGSGGKTVWGSYEDDIKDLKSNQPV